jgi:predicted DsbA family dithiol-disulfide isomerase
MNTKIKIDFVSDIVCPWCIIGFARLEKAIAELGIEDKVDIEWQPFQLNPNMPKEGQNLHEHISEKYGTSAEDNSSNQERLKEMAADEGVEFNFFDEMKMVNTKNAHILLHYAKQQGKQTELNKRLVASFFGEGKDISNNTILTDELKKVGLNETEALSALINTNYQTEVTEKENYWKGLGVNSVPTVVFNNKSALSGAQPTATYKQVLQQLLKEQ